MTIEGQPLLKSNLNGMESRTKFDANDGNSYFRLSGRSSISGLVDKALATSLHNNRRNDLLCG